VTPSQQLCTTAAPPQPGQACRVQGTAPWLVLTPAPLPHCTTAPLPPQDPFAALADLTDGPQQPALAMLGIKDDDLLF
jgi:hypothetical protein